MFNDKRNENKSIKEKQTGDANFIFKHFINNLIEQNALKSQRNAFTKFNFVNFAFSTSLFAVSFNQYLFLDPFSQNFTFFLKFLFYSSSTSLTIINDKTKTIFVANMTSSIAIRQNDDWKNIIIEMTYKNSASNNEKSFVSISNLINHFSDVIDVKDILKYKIFTKFQTYLKSDLKKYDVNTIKIFTHQKTREIKIIRTTSLFNMIKIVINQKKRFINCIVEKLQRLSKH